jgi:O-antigen ligase
MKLTTSSVSLNPTWLFIVVIASLASVSLLATPHYNYAILPGLGLFFLLFMGKFPQIGYYAIAFMIPFGAFRGSLPWAIAAVLIVITLLKFVIEKSITTRLKSPLWPLLLCFVLVNLISSVKSEFSEYALKNVLLLVIGYTFTALGMIFLSKNDFVNYFPKTLVVSIAISASMAVIGYFFKVSAFSYISIEETEVRATGGSIDPNLMSLMVIFCIPLAVNWLLNAQRFLERVFVFGVLGVYALAVMSTFSRTGALIFLITTVLLLRTHAKKLKPTHWGFAVFVAVATICAVIYTTPADYWDRLKSITSKEDKAINRRQSYLTVAKESIKKHPIIGTGTGTFRDIFKTTDYARMFQSKDVEDEITMRRYAHNTYVEHVVGSGIVGLCFFLAIIGMAYKSHQTAYKKFMLSANVRMAEMVRTYQISLLSLLLNLFFLSDIQHKYFLLSLTLSQVALRLSGEVKEDERG